MSAEEKKILKSLCNAIKHCTDAQKAYLLGFAEGVEIMAVSGNVKDVNAKATA